MALLNLSLSTLVLAETRKTQAFWPLLFCCSGTFLLVLRCLLQTVQWEIISSLMVERAFPSPSVTAMPESTNAAHALISHLLWSSALFVFKIPVVVYKWPPTLVLSLWNWFLSAWQVKLQIGMSGPFPGELRMPPTKVGEELTALKL